MIETEAPDLDLVAIAISVDELLAGPGAGADVVLLDLLDSKPSGVAESVSRLVDLGKKVVVFTSDPLPAMVLAAMEAGASGLVMKVDPVETIATAIRDAAAGEVACSGPLAAMLLSDSRLHVKLSERQIDMLEAISQGLPYRLVAKRHGVAEATVREHLSRAAQAYRRVGIEPGNVHGLISRARADGHLPVQPVVPLGEDGDEREVPN